MNAATFFGTLVHPSAIFVAYTLHKNKVGLGWPGLAGLIPLALALLFVIDMFYCSWNTIILSFCLQNWRFLALKHTQTFQAYEIQVACFLKATKHFRIWRLWFSTHTWMCDDIASLARHKHIWRFFLVVNLMVEKIYLIC